jgi:long-chain fatty acid transport protein
MKVFHIQPTASFKITDNISIGAGFVLSPGSVNLQKDLPVQFNDGTFGHAEISGAAMGYGYNLGVYYNPGGFLSAGLSHRSGINMSVSDGQVAFTVPDGLTTSFPNGTLSASLALPSVTTLGLSIKPNASWNIVADINYVGWNTYDTLAFDYATNTSSLVDTKSPRMYQNIFAFRGGAQYTVFAKDKVLNVRFGGGFGFSPVPTGYLTPETPDGNRAYLTSGISYEFNKRFSFDASIYATKVTRADTNLETQLSGTFTTIAWAPGIGINYNW